MANTKATRLEDGGWGGEDRDGVHYDSSTIVIGNPFEFPPLVYSEEELQRMTLECASDVLNSVPGFKYWALCDDRKMDRPNNICGHQQRAFDFYWSIRCGVQRGKLTLGIGTGSCISPGQFGIDRFCGLMEEADNKDCYPEYIKDNGFPHLMLDADEPLPFFDNKFAAVISNHSLEHLNYQEQALKEWFRVTEEEGYICIITPDMTFNQRGCVDPTHTHEFSVDEFWNWINSIQDLPAFEIVALNTLDNAFSFDAVLQKKKV